MKDVDLRVSVLRPLPELRSSIRQHQQPPHRWGLRRRAPTFAAVAAFEDVAFRVGEGDVGGAGGVDANGVDVRLEMGRDAVRQVPPGEAAVVRAEDAALGADTGAVEAAGTDRGGGG